MGGVHWRRVYAGPVQRGFSGAQGPARRSGARTGAFSAGDHEPGVFNVCLSNRKIVRPHEPSYAVDVGLVVLIIADLVLATSNHWAIVLIGVAIWGLHMGMTQGLLATMIANTAPADLRGTAFGFFNLVSGVAMLFASVVAGLTWDSFGPEYTFIVGATMSLLALILVLRNKARQQ